MFCSKKQQAKRDRMAALQPAGLAALAKRRREADAVVGAGAATNHDDDDDVEEAEDSECGQEDGRSCHPRA